MLMLLYELLKFCRRDGEFGRVAKPFRRIVLAVDNEDLETLPASWGQGRDVLIHVLHPVQMAHDRVQLELDVVLVAPASDSVQLLDVAASASSDLPICLFVEGIAGNRQDVDVPTMSLEKLLGDFAAIAHDGNRFDPDLFAVIDKGTQQFRIQERFAASEVDLARSRLLQQRDPSLCFVARHNMRGSRRVKTESA